MQQKATICPYLDLDDIRCSQRLTMSHLADAYRLCFGQPLDCPVYHELQGEWAPCLPPSCEVCAV